MNSETRPGCPLCLQSSCQTFHRDKSRSYFRCAVCRLIFVPHTQHLSNLEEKAHYSLHRNSPADVNYRRFLSQLAAPLLQLLPAKSHGLDFGCGPGPTLSVMLEEQGHHVDVYDEYFYKNESIWETKYDFITSTEVIEHLRKPRQVLEKLATALKPNGLLAIMTQITDDITDFANWHYMRDPTHICFYSSETFRYVVSILNSHIEFASAGILILRLPNSID